MAISRPPPKAVPWIAMITGFAQSSIRVSSGCRSGPPDSGLRAAASSSLISAPEINVRPPPITTTERTEVSRPATSKAARMPSGTPGLSAFTGGLSMVITATPSRAEKVTGWVIVNLLRFHTAQFLMIPRTADHRSESEAATGAGYAWWVVIALTAVYTLSFVDRTILSLLVPSIKRDLGVSDTQIGVLQGLAFSVFYTLMGLPIGRIADRWNRRNLIVGGILVWSLFTTLGSVAKSYLLLFLTRIGVGVGEATLSPAGYSMLSDYFPKRKLGVAISVFYMGVFIGTSLALLVGGTTVDMLARTPTIAVPVLGTMASWRLTFVIVGLPGVLFALLARTIREPVRRDLLASPDGRPARLSFGDAVAQMRMRWQSVVGISLGSVCQSMITYG